MAQWMMVINAPDAATAKAQVENHDTASPSEKALIKSQIDLVVSGMTDQTMQIFGVMVTANRGAANMTCIANLATMKKQEVVLQPPDIGSVDPEKVVEAP